MAARHGTADKLTKYSAAKEQDTMHRFFHTLAVAGMSTAALMLLGCAHHDPTIVGTWAGTVTKPYGISEQFKMTFSANGQETIAINITQGATKMAMAASGTYQIQGKTLTQTMTTVTVVGQDNPKGPQTAKTEIDGYLLNGNTLTLSVQGSATPLVLTRQQNA